MGASRLKEKRTVKEMGFNFLRETDGKRSETCELNIFVKK